MGAVRVALLVIAGLLIAGAIAMAVLCVTPAADRIQPQQCWRAARERFALEPMIAGYFQLYAQLARPRPLSEEVLSADH